MSWSEDIVATALYVGEKVYRYAKWVVDNGPALVEDRANKRLKVDYSAVVSHLPIVRAATVGPLPGYSVMGGVLTADAPGALPAVDGVVLGAGDLVLMRSEAPEHVDHGPYEVVSSGSATASWVLRRAGWFNAEHNARAGAVVAVAEGDTCAGVLMRCRAAGAVELGVTAMGWERPLAATRGGFVSTDILVIGQSNPSGVTYVPAGGYPAGVPPYAELEGPDLQVWNGVSWVQADTTQSGEVVGSIGLFAGALGRRMLDAGASRVRVMMATKSAQGVWAFNPRNPGGEYAGMINELRAAHFNPGLIVYWQGESDEGFSQEQVEPNYGDLLNGDLNVAPGGTSSMGGWLRDIPSCRRVIGVRTHRGATGGSVAGVRASQEAWAAGNRGLIRLVDIDDLVDDGERFEAGGSLPHFTWWGYDEVARRVVEVARG